MAASRQGIRQRVSAAVGELRALQSRKSSLANHLVEQQCWGYLTSIQVQTIASLACKDIESGEGTPPDELMQLAKLGCDDKQQLQRYNVHRDFMRRVVQPRRKIDAVAHFTLPVKIKPKFNPFGRLLVGTRNHDARYAMVAPHLFVSSLWNNRRQTFFTRILGCAPEADVHAHLRSFWSKLAEDDPRVYIYIYMYIQLYSIKTHLR